MHRLMLIAAALLATASSAARAQQTTGLFLNDPEAFAGYTLFAPQPGTMTYLIDNQGKLIQSWPGSYRPGNSVYLLENGHLLRTANYTTAPGPRFNTGGTGGRVQEYTWDGTLVWDFTYADSQHRQHHDVERLPNGNLLMIAWELKSSTEAIAAGRNPALLSSGELWPGQIIEVQPVGANGGTIVWEWHAWDHLIQDYDPTKSNFGVVGDHPELIDLNYAVGSGSADWLHNNSVAYNAAFDQILISNHNFDEIWIIDHSTTTAQAGGHTGGNSGAGGDLLYRWGNPQTYDRGTAADGKLFGQHDAQWIPDGLPGAGNILIFNNGNGRLGGNYSSADELTPPVDENGDYELLPGSAHGPAGLAWTYEAAPPASFYATNISGVQRLPNGNTLLCNGPAGNFIEVTSSGELVWNYVSPVTNSGATTQGTPPVGGNSVFRSPRYAPDYAGFTGVDLTPGDPIEQYTRPIPAPDGAGASDPVTAERLTAAGDWVRVEWDVNSCLAAEYNLIYGNLADVDSYAMLGSECAIGVGGSHDWSGVPAGDIYFLVVGTDGTGVYESSWGGDGSGTERSGGRPSGQCGTTSLDVVESCP